MKHTKDWWKMVEDERWKIVEDGGRWWKMVEDSGRWWKMVEDMEDMEVIDISHSLCVNICHLM